MFNLADSDTLFTPARSALGNTEIELPLPSTSTPDGVRKVHANPKIRRLRLKRRKKSSSIVLGKTLGATQTDIKDLPTIARCGWTIGSHTDVRVNLTPDGTHASFSGIETCKSVWACPTCAAVIRARRAEEIQDAVAKWQEAGNTIVFVTLTVRHQKTDSLSRGLQALMKGFQLSLNRRAWRTLKVDLGIAGFVRSVEVTYGENGWHPHIHALLFLEGQTSEDQISRISQFYAENWAKIVEKLGGRIPNEVHGYDVQLVDKDGKVLSAYLGKFQDEGKSKTALGAEMARSDIKAGYGSSIVPFELLDDENPYKSQSAMLWQEFVETTKGRRAITWSKGLRDLLRLEEEATDEEIIEQDEAEFSETVFLIPSLHYRIMYRNGLLADVLDLVEAGLIHEAVKLSDGYYLE